MKLLPIGNINISLVLQSLLVAFSAVFFSFLWQGSIGFSLWDEGFLWYGVQGVLRGEVPIRDFMAYDPGRYYWSAFISRFIGDSGIMSLRASVAVFQALGLFVGLLSIVKSKKNYKFFDFLFLIFSSTILLVWMFPRHKLFDISLSIFLIGLLTFLISKPTLIRYFLVGIGTGLAAVFGRNHGLYGLISGLGVILWLQIGHFSAKTFSKSIAWWGFGIILGFAPLILLIIFVQGFAVSYWESIQFIFEHGETNLSIPIPWPWSVDYSSLSIFLKVHHFLVGIYFLSLLLFSFSSLFWVFYRSLKGLYVNPVFAATAFLSLPYAHYAFSRADVGHLAHGIFPFLIGIIVCFSLFPVFVRILSFLFLLLSSILVMYRYQPGFLCQEKEACTDVRISNSHLKVPFHVAESINFLRNVDQSLSNDSETFIATPFWPGAYALLQKKSPMWEIYALFPRNSRFEQAEINRLKNARPAYAIILKFSIDNRDELKFEYTHPKTYAYIIQNFQKVTSYERPELSVYKYLYKR